MKTPLLQTAVCIIFIAISATAFTQNPIFFSSGNFNPPNSWTQGNAVRMGSTANTNIQTDTATAVGSCYFRFFSAQSGGVNYAPAGDTDALIPLDTPFAMQVEGNAYKAYYFTTENLTDNYVFKSTGTGSPGNARAAVIRVQGPIQSITALSRFPGGNVYAGQDVNVYATISDTCSPGQGAYLRFTTNNWSSSTVTPMTGTGTQYYATIPGSNITTGTILNYYAFTSGDSLTISPLDVDLMTINLFNNNFANFTFVPQCPLTLPNPKFSLVETDKARYNPGDSVFIRVTFTDTITTGSFDTAATAFLRVAVCHLDSVIERASFPINNVINYSFSFHPPVTDFTGYMVELGFFQMQDTDFTSIAIDVSSTWNRFPRYGFISAYPQTDMNDQQLLFNSLNRYHLNGLQFYDVNHEHNKPLAGSVANPDTVWNDIANRPTYLSTVLAYINLAHGCNMKAMDYNLLYGAYTNTAIADGVLPQWGIYYDQSHNNPVTYTLPATWASNLQVENPADTGWQHYIFANEDSLFQAISFDGWHVDQLGSQGTVYDYNGNSVNLAGAFGTYLQNASVALNVPLVMNGVTNYGQQEIATAPVQFLYTEVWPPFTGYNNLADLIDSNNLYSNNTLPTVFAAYMNQGISDTFGTFNPPAVLLTDAAIFANGGSHIEMGDHMLCNPYFPNSNLTMSCGLQQSMMAYYDFMTGYENLLRDSVSASTVSLTTTGSNSLSSTAATGSIWTISKQKTNTSIFHLINLVNANTLSWNDPNDNQTTPTVIQNIPLSFTSTNILPVKKIYVISPDYNNGIPQTLVFQQTGNNVSFTLPTLNYWSTVVAEYGLIVNSIAEIKTGQSIQVYPNPFHDAVNFNFQSDATTQVTIRIMDELGRVVSETDNYTINAGAQTFNLPFVAQAAGIYLWSVTSTDNTGNPVAEQHGKLVHF
jgi:dextranase